MKVKVHIRSPIRSTLKLVFTCYTLQKFKETTIGRQMLLSTSLNYITYTKINTLAEIYKSMPGSILHMEIGIFHKFNNQGIG